MKFKVTLFLLIVWTNIFSQTIRLPLDPGRYAGSTSLVETTNNTFVYSSIILPPSIFAGAGKTSNLTSVSPLQGVLWSYDYQYTKTSFPSRLSNYNDGFLLAGFVFDNNQNKSLMRLDADGNVIWSKRYGSTNDVDTVNQGVTKAIELSDGNIAFAGGAGSFASDQGNNDLFLAKLDSDGGQIWGKRFCFSCGGNIETIFGNLIETSDGGLLVTGSYLPSFIEGQQILLIKTDANGTTEWIRSYSDPSGFFANSNDRGVQALELPDGSFALIANQVQIFENSPGIVAQIDRDGNIVRALRIRIAPGRAFTLQLNKAVTDNNNALVIAAGITQDSTPDLSVEQNVLFNLQLDGEIGWQYNYYNEILVGFGTAASDLVRTSGGGLAHLTNFSEAFDNFYPILILTDSLGKNGCELPVLLSVETGLQLDSKSLTVTENPAGQPVDYPVTKTPFNLDIQVPSFVPLADSGLCSPDTLVLNIAGENIDTYQWNTGAATSQIYVTAPGVYAVTLTNTEFCFQAIDTSLIMLNDECDTTTVLLNIPNAFTPNGDGINDAFKPIGKNFTTESLQIFNRWGDLIFDKKIPDAAWDGRFKEKDAPVDVYFYLMTVSENGISKKYKGEVTLLR